MKKEFNKTIITLGFIVSLIGMLIDSIIVESAMFAMLGTPIFLGVFSFCFVYANNATLNRFGYVFAAVAGVDSIAAILFNTTDAIVSYIGFIIMFVAAVVYFIRSLLSSDIKSATWKTTAAKSLRSLMTSCLNIKSLWQTELSPNRNFRP